MKAVIQRVTHASVTVNNNVVGEIGEGLLILLGIGRDDSEEDCRILSEKIINMRIFPDENDKTNLSILDPTPGIAGEKALLVVSQFTLYADCKKRRPGFTAAAPPEQAIKLYEYFCGLCGEKVRTERGVFGAHMSVSLLNDGPFTVILETENGRIK